MELTGVAVDPAPLVDDVAGDARPSCRRSSARSTRVVGHEFNIGSPQQLSQILFDELGLPKTRRTKLGLHRPTPSRWTACAARIPIVDLIMRYRGISKLKCTYVDALPALVNPKTKRIHTTFNQTTAATGRLSSNDPNLQNIPVRTGYGNAIRRAFVARDLGDEPMLLAADYSQIELRIMAHLSQDPALIEAFRERRGHPRGDGVERLRRAVRRSDVGAAAPRQGVQLRRALRPERVRPLDEGAHPARGGGDVHPPLLREVRADRRLARRRDRELPHAGLRRDADGAPALHPGDQVAELPGPRRPASAWRSTCRCRARPATSSRWR